MGRISPDDMEWAAKATSSIMYCIQSGANNQMAGAKRCHASAGTYHYSYSSRITLRSFPTISTNFLEASEGGSVLV